MRDKIVAGLQVSTQLAHPRGKQAMFQVGSQNGPALIGLIGCLSDQHRAFWLFVHHPALFEQAAEIETALDDFSLYYQMLHAQMEEVMATSKSRIDQVLNEDQRKKFSRIMTDLKDKQPR